jgi:Mrp family chromosome partitioning ATPase
MSDDRFWYLAAGGHARKTGIQRLRIGLESALRSQEAAAVALSGLDTSAPAVHALAADLAAGIALSDRSVLLIDLDFDHPSGLPEFGSGTTVANILPELDEDMEDGVSRIKRVLNEQPEVLPGLRGMRAGDGLEDPADALTGWRMQELLDQARGSADVVIVVGPEPHHPTSQELSHRVDGVILVCTAGKTTLPKIEQTVRELERRRASLLGIVLTKPSGGLLRLLTARIRSNRRTGREAGSANAAAAGRRRRGIHGEGLGEATS